MTRRCVTADCESISINVSSSIPFDRDMQQEGWKLKNDREIRDGEFILELLDFFQKKESHVSGNELVKRAKEKDALFGQRHAEALLRNKDKIPEKWRKYVLVFPGTVWRDSRGDLRVPCLRWHDRCWDLCFGWLAPGFYSHCRIVRSRN